VIDPNDLARSFEATHGRSPRLYRAPGRVNLIGEHTDYNEGFVMPMAIDRSTWVAAAPRDDGTIVVHSREMGETCTIDPMQGPPADASGSRGRWTDYVLGIAAVLDRERGTSPASGGADLLVASDVPIGAGLSSSAALEVACGYALTDLAGGSVDLTALALAAQRAEHEFVGTRCGIMDQMVACHARAGHALWLDTRTLERRYLPLPEEVRVIICNTMVTHQLASTEYNARRADCETGVGWLGQQDPSVHALRDATLDHLEAARSVVCDRVFRRCRHVITENARVVGAAQALSAGDFVAFGGLMDQSHESLRDDYEVSCEELDTMASIVRRLDGVYGARMTGGGFGGSVVALIEAGAATLVERRAVECYRAATGLLPDVWISWAGPGAGIL
jgi:galactokinase